MHKKKKRKKGEGTHFAEKIRDKYLRFKFLRDAKIYNKIIHQAFTNKTFNLKISFFKNFKY